MFWSPNDRYLAFIKINLSEIPLSFYQRYDEDEPFRFPYAKYRDPLPILDVFVYHLKSGKTLRVPRPTAFEKFVHLDFSSTFLLFLIEIRLCTFITSFGFVRIVCRLFMEIEAKDRVLFNVMKLVRIESLPKHFFLNRRNTMDSSRVMLNRIFLRMELMRL